MNEDYEGKTLNEFFKIKPIKAAKVSEISEIVSSSLVPVEERVNFHIGNPVSSPLLINKYSEIIFNGEESFCDKKYVNLLKNAIEECVPYSKRGGFDKKNPNVLANTVYKWFKTGQQESLEYDLGTKTGKREIIFNSGGLSETLRVFLHSVSKYMCIQPVHIITRQFKIPGYLKNEYELKYCDLDSSVDDWLAFLFKYLKSNKNKPMFLFVGEILKESERRTLREYCIEFPIIIVEVNNAPNHLSVAREAGLIDKVIRFITFEAIESDFPNLSPLIVAGNHEFLSIMETVHFELKGTPATSELLLTEFLINEKENEGSHKKDLYNQLDLDKEKPIHFEIKGIGGKSSINREYFFSNFSQLIRQRTVNTVKKYSEKNVLKLNHFEKKLTQKMDEWVQFDDPFVANNVADLINSFFSKVKEKSFRLDLEKAFISSFCGVHSRYKPSSCLAVSGSSRTALSLLGYHCGINEVIMPDLGWTYHHCFKKVTAVPLLNDLSLDKHAIVEMVSKRLEENLNWKEYGAVILNNPHNASGKVFETDSMRQLLKELLSKKIMVIDDLSYENIHPRPDLKGEPTLKQIVKSLILNGELRQSDEQFLITVHSLSKTDCFAGARLAVVEIMNPVLFKKFKNLNDAISKNSFALFIAYLFYRNGNEKVNEFWLMRNDIFHKRMEALTKALSDFPKNRNFYNIDIIPPMGSMYPRMEINKLPKGISLNWLSSGLAVRGIGLVPLSTFSRTEEGFELGRKTFRLTLGGTDSADLLSFKIRRVLIDLNKLIARESVNYNVFKFDKKSENLKNILQINVFQNDMEKQLIVHTNSVLKNLKPSLTQFEFESVETKESWLSYLTYRIEIIKQKIKDQLNLKYKMINRVKQDNGKTLIKILEKEFFKESLEKREIKFKQRLYDRTVHPTQMYGLKVDILMNQIVSKLIETERMDLNLIENMSKEMVLEFVGETVPISSLLEGEEVLCDLKSLIDAEQWAFWMNETKTETFLSFWSDWDGSTRPSGQGHRLVAAVLIENIKNLSALVELVNEKCKNAEMDPFLMKEIVVFRENEDKFKCLLNDITALTHKLEKKYMGIVPKDIKTGFIKKIGISLNILSDPIDVISEHNNSLERKMKSLKLKRREQLDYYFALNKKLRKSLYTNLNLIKENLSDNEFIYKFCNYKNLLKRFVLTPRIHQKTIENVDPFTINTTINNIWEINDISGNFGNPGMVMGLQISMSTDSSALVKLDRKFRDKRRMMKTSAHIPFIKIIPLFEEKEAIVELKNYLNEVWDYAKTVKDMDGTVGQRFLETICELFIAGSDLSQQLSQSAGAYLYKSGKYDAISWFASKGIAEKVRIKLGSGEPMQRQGGYYDSNSGKKTLCHYDEYDLNLRLKNFLSDSARKSMFYAKSPLCGVMVGGEFRTFQSNVSEKIRHISDEERAALLFHVYKSKLNIENIIGKAVQPMVGTRLETKEKGQKELNRIIFGNDNEVNSQFTEITSEIFRKILYGSEKDLVGIHVISYFISRTTPIFRDRPVVRPGRNLKQKQTTKVVDKLKEIVPLSNYGSMLRAIGHNRAQTVVLGVNQLTTGLFRAFSEMLSNYSNIEEGKITISEQIFPSLPVKEILQTMRIYHDAELSYVLDFEEIFPKGNTVFHVLREDNIGINRFLGLLQKELIRRQGLEPCDFFEGDVFKEQLLPLFRPDLAVLLQKNIFNTDIKLITKNMEHEAPKQWEKEMAFLLEIPLKIKNYRKKIWSLIMNPIKQQVNSFVKLASALNALSEGKLNNSKQYSTGDLFLKDVGAKVNKALKNETDEKMRQFLYNAIYYLSSNMGEYQDIQVDVLKVLKDVKQIVKLEEQALNKNQQELFRFYLLAIARITGENG